MTDLVNSDGGRKAREELGRTNGSIVAEGEKLPKV
jgi:hypothetical protein